MTDEKAREDFMNDVYNTLDFLPTNNEANRIIDSFDRVTSELEQQPCEDWYDVPSDEMTLEQARQAVKDLRKKLAEYLEQEPCDMKQRVEKEYLYESLCEDLKKANAEIKRLSEPFEDAISRQAVDELSKELVHTTRDKADFLCNFWEGLQKLPPVILQPCEDCISKQDALNCVTSNEFRYRMVEDIKALPSVTPKSKSEYEHDHEVVKAYNDGQANILDKIRAEIENDFQFKQFPRSPWSCGLRRALEIIDKYRESEDKE